MERKKLTALAAACAVTMCLTVKCQAFSFFTGNEENDAGCAWVQDDGYYYLPNIDDEDMENIRISESNVASKWQYIDSEGVITDELMNFGYTGDGRKFLGFGENEKYVYFFDEISDQINTGSLCYIETKYLTYDQKEVEKHIIKVDTDVFISTRPVVHKDGSVIYNRKSEESYNGTLCYFDGKQIVEIAEQVGDFDVTEENIVYYTRWKEYSERKDDGCSGEYDLYGARIGQKDSEKQIGNDIYDYLNGPEQMELFYLNEGEIYFLEGGNKLCRYSYGGKKEVLASDIYTIQWKDNKVVYVYKDKTMKIQDFFDGSQSVHNEEEIKQFFKKLQDIYGNSSIIWGIVRLYDCKTGKDKTISEKCKVLWGEDEDGNVDALFYPCIIQEGDKVVLSYIDITSTEKNLALKKISIDDVLSNPTYSLENEEAISAILDEKIGDLFEDAFGDDRVLQYYVETDESENPIYLQDIGIAEVEDWESEMSVVYLFNDEQNFARVDDAGNLRVGKLSDGYCTECEIIENEVTGAITIGEKLFYKKNNTIYWYDGGSSISIGSVYDDDETYYKGYDDGTVLMLVYYNGRQYGGTLVQIGVNNYKYEIDSNVTDFWELESGEILYISEGKLILYSGNVKIRIADNVKFAWPLSEKKTTDYVKEGW